MADLPLTMYWYAFCGMLEMVTCISHKTRLQNVLRASGIDPIEKALLKQRFVNLSAGQVGYMEKQRKAMAN
jgi:hypothetical protein